MKGRTKDSETLVWLKVGPHLSWVPQGLLEVDWGCTWRVPGKWEGARWRQLPGRG